MAALSNKEEGFEICLVASDRPADGLEIAATAGHRTVLVDRDIYQSKQEHEAELDKLRDHVKTLEVENA